MLFKKRDCFTKCRDDDDDESCEQSFEAKRREGGILLTMNHFICHEAKWNDNKDVKNKR